MFGCFVFPKAWRKKLQLFEQYRLALKNCQPFYARYCKVIRIEPIMGEVLPRKGRGLSIPIDRLNNSPPPPPFVTKFKI